MMQELAGKGVIVTGGSVGLGKAVARACLRAGAHVMICARHEADIQAARRDLSNETDESRVFAMQANVADPASVSEMIDAASRRLPNLLGIVNNAGMQGPKGLLEENDPRNGSIRLKLTFWVQCFAAARFSPCSVNRTTERS